MDRKWVDGAKRAGRTWVQGAIGFFFLTYLAPLMALLNDIATAGGDNGVIDWSLTFWSNALLACAAGGFIALIALAQNWLEDAGMIPTLGKPTDRKVGDAAMGE
jgi:hypothetical protein